MFWLSCLVTEVTAAAPAVGQTIPSVVTNIRRGDEKTAPATSHRGFLKYLDFRRYFFPFGWQEIDDLKFITLKSFSHEFAEKPRELLDKMKLYFFALKIGSNQLQLLFI